jgi:hypothetical protein
MQAEFPTITQFVITEFRRAAPPLYVWAVLPLMMQSVKTTP